MPDQFIEPKTLIDELIAEQKSLTAAARFARVHEQHALPAQARYYRDLIPLHAPGPGQQYAFEVDLDQCSGCKACVTACHALNGLDDEETWRSVGVLHSPSEKAHQRTVTTACHHCVDPGCLNGCPVLAYEKDPITGIVKHLDDQCIGCSYCVLKCPYEVPQYSRKRGIVRKCDMCSSRLESGEAPACVQACPNEAIRIATVDRAEVSRAFAESTAAATETGNVANDFLPDSPDPNLTRPTTQYRSAEPLPLNLRAADHAELTPAQAHPPLVSFLVLTQMAAGGFLVAALLARDDKFLAAICVAAGQIGLLTSVLHLGRPLKAWRAFLGLRRSWLSREIIAFGGFAPASMMFTAALWLPAIIPAMLQIPLAVGAAGTGLLGVFASVMVYHDTGRKFWNWKATTIKFGGSAIILGAATLLVTSAAQGSWSTHSSAAILLAVASLAKVAWSLKEAFLPAPARQLQRTAQLLTGPLCESFSRQIVCLVAGGILLPLISLIEPSGFWVESLALVVCLAAELIERHLYFVAVSPDRMPGMPS
jgi:Fe-S-cluster-containing dehydrogenase component/DMSO reductase anchor subunit